MTLIRVREDTINPAFLPLVRGDAETRKPLDIIEGGRGSGKSRAIAQHLVLAALARRIRIALVRKVHDTINHSMVKEISDVVEAWGLTEYFEFLSNPLGIRVANGSEFITRGLDKAVKFKSTAGVDVVWAEECTELTENDYLTVSLTIRGVGDTDTKQKIISFNRLDGSWLERLFFNSDGSFREQDSIYHHHSSFVDNHFLDRPFIEELESLRSNDIDLYKRHALGLPVRLKGLVYPVWDIRDLPAGLEASGFGIDFGYSDPSVCVGVYFRGKDVWLDEAVYAPNLLNSEFCALCDARIPGGTPDLYADSAEPDRVEEFYRYARKQGGRFNIMPVEKTKGSIADGIDLLKRYNIHATPRSLNLQRELGLYSWKKDLHGQVIDRTPLSKFDHSLDAARYATWMLKRDERLAAPKMGDFQFAPLVSDGFHGY